MPWQTVIDPLGNLGLSALMAAVPVIYLFWALAFKRMAGHWAAMSAVGIALLIAIIGYGMPAQYAVLATLNGCLFGLWPVSWIIVTALFLSARSLRALRVSVRPWP